MPLQDKVFTGAWLKLLNKRSRYARDKPLAIDGRECNSEYTLDDSCMAGLDSDEASDAKCSKCNGEFKLLRSHSSHSSR
jgi:hypothetical protein